MAEQDKIVQKEDQIPDEALNQVSGGNHEAAPAEAWEEGKAPDEAGEKGLFFKFKKKKKFHHHDHHHD